MDTGSPTVLLQQYLAVMTKGSCRSTGDETFDISNFPPKKAYLSASIKGDIHACSEHSLPEISDVVALNFRKKN
jgi:hypothetical protein